MLVRRESVSGANDLSVVYRPCQVSEILGNEVNKRILKNSLDSKNLAHTNLFVGDAGCGKTTAARIVALSLNCEQNGISSKPCLECKSCKSIINQNSIDVLEINVGQSGGKDAVNAIVKDLPQAPFDSRFKIIIFDEAHKLTDAAQALLLKVVEDGFKHVYFILCTNRPEKLKLHNDDAFLSRCTILHFNRLPKKQVYEMLINICEFEGYTFDNQVLDHIAEESDGVPRRALVWLKQIADDGSWTLDAAKEITGLGLDEDNPAIIDLSRALVAGKFKESLKQFNSLTKKNVATESIRIATAGYFVGCLKRVRSFDEGRKFSKILDIVNVPIYDTGKNAQYKMINYMFKIADIVNNWRN